MTSIIPAARLGRRTAPTIQERVLLLAAQRANERLEFLLEASRLLSGSLDLKSTLDQLCRLVAPRLADWCVVDLLDGQRSLNLEAAADSDPAKVALLRRMRRLYPPDPDRHPAYRALRTGRPQIVQRVDEAYLVQAARSRNHLRLLKTMANGSFVCVPLGEAGHHMGTLTLGFAAGGRLLGGEEVRLAEELGRRAGAAISNALLYQQAVDAESKLHRALSAARMAAWDWDLEAGEVLRSGPALELFGLPARGRAGAVGERVHPEDRDRRRKIVRRAAARGGRYVCRYRLQRQGGPAQWVEEHGCVEGSRASGVLLDVTASQDAEERLRRHEAEQRLILDTVEAMIWYKDADNNVVGCNEAAARWAGVSRKELEGRSAYDIFPRSEAKAFHEDDLEVLRDGRPRRGVILESAAPTGERRWIRRDKIPFKNASGKAGVIIFAVDITDQKKAEDSLRESERLQREFVANVSHEFRTPVAAIKGFAETLRRGAIGDRRNRRRFVRTIEAHAERLGWLVEDVLTLSSLEAGKGLQPQALNVSELLRDYARSVSPVSRAKNVSLSVRAPQRLEAWADQPYLLQVVENLVSNAIKFNRPGGKVWLTAQAHGAEVVVTVRDNGPGVPKGCLPRVFDRFFKAPCTGARGTGLGLNIAKLIVERHGGRIWAESVPGKGASFHFALPRPPLGGS